MREISALAVNRLTKPWEEFVAYPYDDKVPKQRGADGKRRYPEYKGGPVRGTITQGYGHTDAAGGPKIVVGGEHWTEQYAAEVLAADMRPCCAAVDRLITVPLTQHQYDALVDFVFNAGAGTLQKSTLRKRLNAGDYDCVPAELMKFTFSKGEHMEGLVHRRQAEIAMWKTPDEKAAQVRVSPPDHGLEPDEVICPKGDLPPVRSALDSKTVAAGGTAIATTVSLMSKVSDTTSAIAQPATQVRDNLASLGLWDGLVALVSAHAVEIAAAVVIALIGFMIYDRVRHLRAERA